MKRVVLVVAALAAVGAAVAIGLGRRADPPREPKQVRIEAVRFAPAELTLALGDVIVWTNGDPFPHNVTALGGRFESGEIAAGQVWRYQPAARGTFEYVCTLHPGMKASLHVE